MTSNVPEPALTSPRTGAPAIVAIDLRKAFGKHVALDGVSLTVPRGSLERGRCDVSRFGFVR